MIANKSLRGIILVFFLVVLAGVTIGEGRLTQEGDQLKDTLDKPQTIDAKHKGSTEQDIEGEEEVDIGKHGRD